MYNNFTLFANRSVPVFDRFAKLRQAVIVPRIPTFYFLTID